MYESQLAQLTQQTFNMESAALATENLRNTMATVDAMKQANKELKKQYGKIDIDKIEVRFVSFGPLALVRERDDASGMLTVCVRDRVYITTWRISWSRRTRSRRRLGGHTRFRTRLTRRTCRRVRMLVQFSFTSRHFDIYNLSRARCVGAGG